MIEDRSIPNCLVSETGAEGPWYERFAGPLDVGELLERLSGRPHCLLLDSALRRPELGRYSFLAADPFAWITVPADGSEALAPLAARLGAFRSPTIPGLPPFQGGAAGLFAYDLNRSLERLEAPEYDEFRTPALAIGLYDVLLAIDHVEDAAWIISHGFPETAPADRRRRALDRLAEMRRWLTTPATPRPARLSHDDSIGVAQLAPQFSTRAHSQLTSNFSASAYCHAVQRTIDYIRAGDAFQVNLAQRLLYPARDDSLELYLRLRARNPATFAAYFDLGDFQILSASPERFLQVRAGVAEARPIKGTRQRFPQAEANLYLADELLQSEKDRAENVMIADLLRNDLSRVCTPDSVCVTELCKLETYEFVQHLVSAVRGVLRPELGPFDLIRAAFPGGSITGAPKVRAMEIITELERTARGPYCGSLGYIGFDGTMDLNILIRTITAGRGWWQLPVGGGITAQSQPQREYEETWHKAAGLLRALE